MLTVAKECEEDLEIIREKICDERCRIHLQTGRGLGNARNEGLYQATGEIVWFLDVDDYPLPTFLEDLVPLLDKTNSDIVFCNHIQTFSAKKPHIPKKIYCLKEYSHTEALEHFNEFPVYSWSRIQKKSIFDKGKCYFEAYGAMEDYDQTFRELLCSNKVCYFGKPLYVYRKTSQSATLKNRLKETEVLEAICQHNLELIERKEPEVYESYLLEIVNRMMRQSTFSPHKIYKKWYESSEIHNLIEKINPKSLEMRLFERSANLYYLCLLPFSHLIWDSKVGAWGPL